MLDTSRRWKFEKGTLEFIAHFQSFSGKSEWATSIWRSTAATRPGEINMRAEDLVSASKIREGKYDDIYRVSEF